jgi:hypothetical protein
MKYQYMTYTPELKTFISKKPAENIEIELKKLKSEGWELITVVPIFSNMETSYGGTTGSLVYYFKRAI